MRSAAAHEPRPSRSMRFLLLSRLTSCSAAWNGFGERCETARARAAHVALGRRGDSRRHPHPDPVRATDYHRQGRRRDGRAGADDGGPGAGFLRPAPALCAGDGAGRRHEGWRPVRSARPAGAAVRLLGSALGSLGTDRRGARHARVRQAGRGHRLRARVQRQDLRRRPRQEARAGGCRGGRRFRRDPGDVARRILAVTPGAPGAHPGGRDRRHPAHRAARSPRSGAVRPRGDTSRADRDAGAADVRPALGEPLGDRAGRSLQRAAARDVGRNRQRVSSGRLAARAKAVRPRRHAGGNRRDREPAGDHRPRQHAVLRGTAAGPRVRAGGSQRPDSSPHPDLAARQSLARLGRRREQGRRGDFQAVGAAGDASHRAAHRLGAGPGGAGCRGERVRRLAGLHASSRRGHRSAKRLRPKGRLRRANSRGAVAPLQPGGHAVNHSSSDRALQDDVIRALADAPYRASPRWRRRNLADPYRVERYARFLARHFYFERIVQFFKYSRALARITGRPPEAVCKVDAFDLLLPRVVLGSRGTAQAVARLVVAHVAAARAPIPYLADLLRYEEAMMLVEAGPRVWRETGKAETGHGKGEPPETVEGTLLLDLQYDLPAVLPRLLEPWTAVQRAPERPTQLLVARSPPGRVAVAKSDAGIASVVGLADGKRTIEQLAAGAGLPVGTLEATLQGLVELGAVRFSTGS